jgi:hypothetical protein
MTGENRRQHKLKSVLAAVLILLAGAFVLEKITTTTAKDETVVVKASVNKDCTVTPWFVGEEKGFFEDGGVDLVDVGQIAAPQRPAAFASGQLDVFDNHPSYLVNFLKAGVPIIAVAHGGDEPTDGDIKKLHMHWLVLENRSAYIISYRIIGRATLGYNVNIDPDRAAVRSAGNRCGRSLSCKQCR